MTSFEVPARDRSQVAVSDLPHTRNIGLRIDQWVVPRVLQPENHGAKVLWHVELDSCMGEAPSLLGKSHRDKRRYFPISFFPEQTV